MKEFLGLTLEEWTLISVLMGVLTTIISLLIQVFNKTTVTPLRQSIERAVEKLSLEIDQLREDLAYSRKSSKENDKKLFEKLDRHESKISYHDALIEANSKRIDILEEKNK